MLVVGSITGVPRMPISWPSPGQGGTRSAVGTDGPKFIDHRVVPLSARQAKEVLQESRNTREQPGPE